MQQKLYFNPPNSELKLPLTKRGKNLKFSFFEIGCKPHKKRGQVFRQESEFRKNWKDYYQKQLGVKWEPSISKYIIHFHQDFQSVTYNLNAKTNGYFTCTEIPFFLFSQTTDTEDERLFKKVNNAREREMLEGIINSGANEELIDLIVNSKKLSGLRGYSAELFMQKSLAYAARRTGVKYLPNYMLRNNNTTNKKHKNTSNNKHRIISNPEEIDMLIAYYDDGAFKKFIDRVANQPHMKFSYDRHKIYRPEEFQKIRV